MGLMPRAVRVNTVRMVGSRSLGVSYDSQSAGGLVEGGSQRVRSRNVLSGSGDWTYARRELPQAVEWAPKGP